VTPPAAPLLTIGIPLHRSRPFVEVASANIAAVDRTDVEFLVSDATGHDDALPVLAARHAGDPRVAPLRTVDGADWVDHCNALLRRARGTYFCWMPHDDSFPPGWVDTLLGCLEAAPDVLMAFGRIDPVSVDGAPAARGRYRHPAPGTESGPWTVHDAVTAVTEWRAGYAFTGVFRRGPVVARGLFLPRTRDGIAADTAWVFGMALLGRLRYVPEAVYHKRYHEASAHGTWRYRAAHHLSLGWALARYAVRYGASPAATVVALAAAAEVTAKRLVWGPGERWAGRFAVRARSTARAGAGRRGARSA
jgi:GT2 family glycosyltransferase